jgi:hypothetical protein
MSQLAFEHVVMGFVVGVEFENLIVGISDWLAVAIGELLVDVERH